MTTETELRDILLREASAPGAAAPWDDVVRRGRHHRRVRQIRTGVAAVAVVVVALVGALAGRGALDEDGTTVVVDQPDHPTTSDAPASVERPLPDLEVARVSDRLVTFTLTAAAPEEGFDPCMEQHAIVTETATAVTLRVGHRVDTGASAWVACRASAFSGWATVELAAPLGDRRLVDASTGREVRVVRGADLLLPSQLPEPFDLAEREEFAQGAYEGAPVGAWTFSWVAGDLVLNVGRWGLNAERPEGCTGGTTVEVRDVTAQACRGEGSDVVTLLSWSERGSFYVLELADVGGDPLEPEVDLLAIAESLQRLD